MIRGRPLRSLIAVLGGWTAMRLAMVVPVPASVVPGQPQLAQRVAPVRVQVAGAIPLPRLARAIAMPPAPDRPWAQPVAGSRLSPIRPARLSPAAAAPGGWSLEVADMMLGAQIAFVHAGRAPLALTAFAAGSGLSPREAGLPGPPAAAADRWSGSGWMLWRPEGPVDRPMLDGAQVGGRVDYALAPHSRLRPAIYGRVTSALGAIAAAEGAVGLAIRPRTPVPLILAVERRQALSPGARSDFAVVAAGGINPSPIGKGFRIDGYGQAGVVGLASRDAFADGRLTVERPVIGPDIALGVGIWGGAQPGVARLDLGPQASVRLRLGGASFRLAAEWRAQVAGRASPVSGPALSIGTDF